MWLLAFALVASDAPLLTFRSHQLGDGVVYETVIGIYGDRAECSNLKKSFVGSPTKRVGTKVLDRAYVETLIASLESFATAAFPPAGSVHAERVEWKYLHKGLSRTVSLAPVALGERINCRDVPWSNPAPGLLSDTGEECDTVHSSQEQAALDLREKFFALAHEICRL